MLDRFDFGEKWGKLASELPTIFLLKDSHPDIRNPRPYGKKLKVEQINDFF